MSIAAEIQEMKKKRFQFLFRCWELSGGDEHEFLNMNDIGEELGFGGHEIWVIYQYLAGEGLIKGRTIGGGMSITHWGIEQVEAAMSEPEAPTEYFPPVVNIIAAEQIIDSQIQQASADATQVIYTEDKYEQLRELIGSLTGSIDQLRLEHQQQTDLLAQIHTIDAQMSSSKPSSVIISESLGTVRTILEEAAGSVLAVGFVETIKALLAG